MAARMLIQVEIKTAELRVMEGVARRTGRPYKMVEQSCWVDLGKEYPQEVRFVLGDQQAPYPPGRYLLDEKALQIDRNGVIQISMRALKAAQPQPAQAAKAV